VLRSPETGEKLAGQDGALDLVGALVDLSDLGVAYHPLDRVIPDASGPPTSEPVNTASRIAFPVELKWRTGTNTFSPSFAYLDIRAASSSAWRYSANADVIGVEAELADGLACPFFIRNPGEISRPG
jgi:hypothetical protein